MIGEIVDIILDIHRIEDYCEGGEYSRTGEWEADMRGSFNRDAGNGYNRGNSYANRGRHYVRGHYSRTDGRERMISDIEEMMQDATGAERDAYNARRTFCATHKEEGGKYGHRRDQHPYPQAEMRIDGLAERGKTCRPLHREE